MLIRELGPKRIWFEKKYSTRMILSQQISSPNKLWDQNNLSLKNCGPKKHDPIRIVGPQIFGVKKNVWVQKLMVLTNYELKKNLSPKKIQGSKKLGPIKITVK